jgi:molecular chaperone GrpE (heat shock protein)
MLIIKQIKKENETLKKQLEQLEAENQKLKQIASTLQTQYLNLSEEFEAYRKRISNQQEQQKIQNLIDIIKKIIPLVEQLRISIENIPKDIQNHKWVEGIRLTYKNLLKILESLGIYQKDSI